MSQRKLYKDRNLQILFSVTLVAVMGVTSVAPAFPRIVEDLQISATDVGMLVVAFTIPTVFLSPLMGIFADRLGRKRLLVPSILLFGLAGGACAFSKDFNMLVLLRAFQGIGAAGISFLSVAIMGDLYTGEQRTEAMGLNASVIGAGTAAYPIIGGALATLAWNYPFLLAFFGLPVGFIVLRFLDNPEPQSSGSIKEYLTGIWGYLKNIRMWSAFLAGIIGFTVLFGAALTYFALYLGDKFHASPFIIGVLISLNSVATLLVAMQLGRLIKITSIVNLVKLGFAVCAIATALIPLMPSLLLMIIPSALFGAGFAVIFPCIHIYVAGLVPSNYRAVFMAMSSTMFQLGKTLGPVIVGMAFVYGGYNGAFFFAAGLTLVPAVVGVIGGRILR